MISRFVRKTVEKMVSFLISECLDELETTIGHGNTHPDYNFELIGLKIFNQIPVKQYTFPETFVSGAYFWTFNKILNRYILSKLENLLQSEIAVFSGLINKFLIKNIHNSELSNSYFRSLQKERNSQ